MSAFGSNNNQEKAMSASAELPGSETIYPGSHELRIISLIPSASPLAQEGMLVLASLERLPLGAEPEMHLARKLELLAEAADEICRQAKETIQLLATCGHRAQ